MSVPLAVKYRPDSGASIPGREDLVKRLLAFITNYSAAKKKAILLHGPSGSGKTSLVVAVAKQANADLFEMNASDKRNKGTLEEILLPVITTQSFFAEQKVVLLDEVDGLSGKDDRGGVAALTQLVKRSRYPIIMTANDGYNDKLKALRKEVEVIEVAPLDTPNIAKILASICEREKIEVTTETLSAIARKNAGDLRGSINDLELLSLSGKIDKENVLALAERLKNRSIEQALTLIFKSTDPALAISAFDDVQEDVDDWFMWLDYNVAKEYTGVLDRARAYGMLSRADIFRGRIRRRQYWRLLVYIRTLLTSGIAIAKDKPYRSTPSYKRSSRPLRIWMLNNQIAKKRSIAAKIAEATHTSTKSVLNDFSWYAKVCNNLQVQEQLKFDDAEIQWLQKL